MTKRVSDEQIRRAKESPVQELWARLGLGEATPKKNVLSPWREEKEPSVCVGGKQNTVHDFGTGETWDTIALVRKVRECGFTDAVEWILSESALETQKPRNAEQNKTKKASSKWTEAQAKQYLKHGYRLLLENEVALQCLQAYGLTRGTIEKAPLAWLKGPHGGLILYTDSLEEPTMVKARSVARKENGKRSSFFRYGKPKIWFPFGRKKNAHIVLVGGEEKVLVVGQETDYLACSTMSGEGPDKLTSAMAQEIGKLKPSRVTIALDADETGRKASPVWAQRLHQAGVEDIRIVTWPVEIPK